MANPTGQEILLLNELTQGREIAKKLKSQIDDVTISPEAREALVQKLLSTYDKALAMLTWRAVKEEEMAAASPETVAGGMVVFAAGSPQSHSPISGSPLSEISNGRSRDEKCSRKDVSKKRKVSAKCSHQVRVCSKRQDGFSLDDGYSWRKYGQKDILGSKNPRAYYRCTHRNSRGCLATKQVQKTDEDSSIFEVIYKGNHSCIQTANPSAISFSERMEISKPNTAQDKQTQPEPEPQPQQMLQNISQGLTVETEAMRAQEEIFPPLTFPFTGAEYEDQENFFFPEPDMMDGGSPTTSEAYYLSSPCFIADSDISKILLNSQYAPTDLITTPTSVMNSPFGHLDFPLDQVDLEPYLQLDTIAYLS